MTGNLDISGIPLLFLYVSYQIGVRTSSVGNISSLSAKKREFASVNLMMVIMSDDGRWAPFISIKFICCTIKRIYKNYDFVLWFSLCFRIRSCPIIFPFCVSYSSRLLTFWRHRTDIFTSHNFLFLRTSFRGAIVCIMS